MRIVVSADGEGLVALASSVFGRCQAYVFVDTESMEAETVENPAIGQASGAGIQAAQFVVDEGAEAVITGNVGPNAYNVLQASGTPVYLLKGGTVRDVVEAYKKDQLPRAGGATSQAHAGLGRGMGRGRGVATAGGPIPASSATRPQAPSAGSSDEDIAELKEMVGHLRSQLADVLDRLDRFEKEE
ncbi:MAG: NifB/NifX family molybdenum-iron cluster-binding protein [Anaerolineae bacterium]|jgi:predicted Fe-Mo cluster-binding NifX family protein